MTDLRQAAQQALKALEVLSKLGNGGTDGNSVGNIIAQEAREHLFTALAQPVQEPVTCRFCHSKKGCWAWQCYKCGEIDDVQKPAPLPLQEPVAEVKVKMTGGNAGIATIIHEIYDPFREPLQAGDKLYTTPPLPEQQPVGEVVKINNDGFKCEFSQRLAVGTKLYTAAPAAQPAQQPVAWAVQACSKMWCGEFAEIDAKAEAKRIGGTCVAFALYTEPPQRPWAGLTEQDMPSGENPMFDHQYFCAGMVYAAKVLQDKNHG
jgi:hypothetical protein